MSAIIEFGTVDTEQRGSGGAARVQLYDGAGNALLTAPGGDAPAKLVVVGGVNDGRARPVRMDRLGGVALADITPLLHEGWDSATMHSGRWVRTDSGFVQAITTNGGLLLNSAGVTTANGHTNIVSKRLFSKMQRAPLLGRFRARGTKVSGTQWEVGFGAGISAVAVPTVGAYWRCGASGIQPVVTFNGTEVAGDDVASLISDAIFYSWDVIVDDDSARFVCQRTSDEAVISDQVMRLPDAQERVWAQSHVAAFARVYNGPGTAPSAPQLRISDVLVGCLDNDIAESVGSFCAGLHLASYQNPQTGAQMLVHTNSAEPASATLSNTAAGYTQLGGKFQFSSVAGAATDYLLFSLQTPATHELRITGVDIETWNVGAAVATTPTLLTWFLGVDGGAANLSTGAHVRVPLGAQSLAVATPIGGAASPVRVSFGEAGIVHPPNRFFAVGLRMPVGTATASQVIAGHVTVHGHWR